MSEFESVLRRVLINSDEDTINRLTRMAEANKANAAFIVHIIQMHILQSSPTIQLCALYLIDSIIKNIGGRFVNLFGYKIDTVFSDVFKKADRQMRRKLYTLRQWWKGVFPEITLLALDKKIKELDPAWPITAKVELAQLDLLNTKRRYLELQLAAAELSMIELDQQLADETTNLERVTTLFTPPNDAKRIRLDSVDDSRMLNNKYDEVVEFNSCNYDGILDAHEDDEMKPSIIKNDDDSEMCSSAISSGDIKSDIESSRGNVSSPTITTSSTTQCLDGQDVERHLEKETTLVTTSDEAILLQPESKETPFYFVFDKLSDNNIFGNKDDDDNVITTSATEYLDGHVSHMVKGPTLFMPPDVASLIELESKEIPSDSYDDVIDVQQEQIIKSIDNGDALFNKSDDSDDDDVVEVITKPVIIDISDDNGEENPIRANTIIDDDQSEEEETCSSSASSSIETEVRISSPTCVTSSRNEYVDGHWVNHSTIDVNKLLEIAAKIKVEPKDSHNEDDDDCFEDI